MRRLIVGLALMAGCGRETTAPRVLRLVPGITPESAAGLFTDGGPITSDGQSAVVGAAITVTVAAIDQNGEPVSGVEVVWTLVGAGGSTSEKTVLTDALGNATVKWTLDTIARVNLVDAFIPNGASVEMWAVGKAGPPARAVRIGGDSVLVTAGTTSVPLAVHVTDRYGNPVSGQTIAWLATGGGVLSAPIGHTDSSGLATVTLTDTPSAGSYSVIATLGFVPAVMFTVIAR